MAVTWIDAEALGWFYSVTAVAVVFAVVSVGFVDLLCLCKRRCK